MTERNTTLVEVRDLPRDDDLDTAQPVTSEAFVPVSRSGLADQLAEHLLADVVGGIYPPDSKLPPEPVLAERAGVSRLTLREAIKDLRQRGVLRVQQGRGTFVNPPRNWSAFDTQVLNARASCEQGFELAHELIELRRIVERGIAELAAGRRSEEDLARLEASKQAMKDAWIKRDLTAFGKAEVEFHDSLLRAAGNTFALTLFHSVDGALQKVRGRSLDRPELAQQALDAYTKLMAAMRRKSKKLAGQIMDEHLQHLEDHLANLVATSKSKRGTA